ncbi:MAG: AAA family ATPase [Candidatus Omnitrophica bacterium]|nr:AAA family ATPase [Patescibacteria group bacterium]MBU4312935.1 AAA family ATPase [Candidatus Omnitrophota bacterium]
MKIKEFAIIRYGPLPNRGRVALRNFNLLFGKNEEGKTLTIDALVKLLLGKHIKDFRDIDRVEENPEGYVVLEDDKGNEVKLTEKTNLTKVAELTPSECRNIFIIRDSDISIDSESEFYTNVTDRLTGLRAEEISNIKKALLEMGKITPGGSFRDDAKSQKLKTRLEGAKTLIEKIDTLSEKIKREKLDELEEELVGYSEKLKGIKQIIGNLESARRRKRFEEGKEALDKLKQLIATIKDLDTYNKSDAQLWRDCDRDIQKFKEDKDILFQDFAKKEDAFKEMDRKVQEDEREFLILEERKKKIDGEVKIELKNCEIKTGELAQQEQKNRFFTKAGSISLVILGIALIGLIVTQSRLLYIPIILLSFLSVFPWIFKYQFIKDRAWVEGAFERIKLTLSKFDLSGKDLEEIISNIQKFDEEYSKKSKELEDMRTGREVLRTHLDRMKGEISNIEKKKNDKEEQIDTLKKAAGVELLKEYSDKLSLKQEQEKLLRDQKVILESNFGTKSSILEENVSFWDEKVQELAEYKDKSKEMDYDESMLSKMEEEGRTYEERYNDLSGKMKELQKELEEVERETNKIIELDTGFLYCRTSVDLNAVREKLQEFIDSTEDNKDTVLKVIGIFEEIEVEEKGKVSELFGKESDISGYFNKITGGVYEEVLFNRETEKIEVKRKDGTILYAEKLSGGTYDQLYLSIRLVLGEKILKGKKGFFIMDDPFIKADPDRLHRQLEMLMKISELGWQVIYFSAKGEVKDVLDRDIKEGLINYVELQSI